MMNDLGLVTSSDCGAQRSTQRTIYPKILNPVYRLTTYVPTLNL